MFKLFICLYFVELIVLANVLYAQQQQQQQQSIYPLVIKDRKKCHQIDFTSKDRRTCKQHRREKRESQALKPAKPIVNNAILNGRSSLAVSSKTCRLFFRGVFQCSCSNIFTSRLENYIITAAHCLKHDQLNPSDYAVEYFDSRANATSLFLPKNYFIVRNDTRGGSFVEHNNAVGDLALLVIPRLITEHFNYDDSLSLVILRKNLTTQEIKTRSDWLEEHFDYHAAGFGMFTRGPLVDYISYPPPVMITHNGENVIVLTAKQDEGPSVVKTICRGDSGGPFFACYAQQPDNCFQIGVNSRSAAICSDQFPQLGANVFAPLNLSWLYTQNDISPCRPSQVCNGNSVGRNSRDIYNRLIEFHREQKLNLENFLIGHQQPRYSEVTSMSTLAHFSTTTTTTTTTTTMKPIPKTKIMFVFYCNSLQCDHLCNVQYFEKIAYNLFKNHAVVSNFLDCASSQSSLVIGNRRVTSFCLNIKHVPSLHAYKNGVLYDVVEGELSLFELDCLSKKIKNIIFPTHSAIEFLTTRESTTIPTTTTTTTTTKIPNWHKFPNGSIIDNRYLKIPKRKNIPQ